MATLPCRLLQTIRLWTSKPRHIKYVAVATGFVKEEIILRRRTVRNSLSQTATVWSERGVTLNVQRRELQLQAAWGAVRIRVWVLIRYRRGFSELTQQDCWHWPPRGPAGPEVQASWRRGPRSLGGVGSRTASLSVLGESCVEVSEARRHTQVAHP